MAANRREHWEIAKRVGDDGGRWDPVGSATMLPVLVLGSYFSGKLWKIRDAERNAHVMCLHPSPEWINYPIANTVQRSLSQSRDLFFVFQYAGRDRFHRCVGVIACW